MTGAIYIRGLCVETHIGVTEKERSRPQDVIVDLEVDTDLTQAATSDDVADTIDYDGLISAVAGLIRNSECKLLEHLAGRIADLVAEIPGVYGVTVEVGKEEIPVDEVVRSASVRIHHGGKRS